MRRNHPVWTGIIVVVPLVLAMIWIGGYSTSSWITPKNPADDARILQEKFVKELSKAISLKKKIMENFSRTGKEKS